MKRPNFLNSNIETQPVQNLTERSYIGKISEIKSKGKLLKRIKEFPSVNEALEYLKAQPQKENHFERFLPKTDYIVGDSPDSQCAIYAVTEKIDGKRLDQVDLKNEEEKVYQQLDDFLFESLGLYQSKKVCPGLNLKNLVLDANKNLFYVDSEPFPPYEVESFEIAHDRKEKLEKIFGSDWINYFPKTHGWVMNNLVDNYRKSKNEAKKRRKK